MAAPQLRLEVSLNLAGFRGEIQKLTNIAQSEFAPKINVKFNRQTLDTELNNLQAAIKRRTYRVQIGGNIDTLPDKIKALKEQLASLESFKIDLGIGAVKSLSKKDASKIKSDLRAEILGEQTKIYVPVSIKPSITREDVRNFKNTVKSKLTGLSVDVKANVQGGGAGAGLPPDFMKYMAEQGLLGKTASGMTMRMGKDGGDIKQQLNDAVGSAEKIKSIFDGVAQSIATTGKSIANIQGKRLGLANVPLMAGAMEKRIERSASVIEGTESFDALKSLYPEINKTIVSLAALRGQVQQNTSKLSGFSLIIGLAAFAGVPLAKSIVKLTGSADKFSKLLDELGPRLEAALTKAASNILNATSSRLLSGGSVAGLLSAGSVAGLLPPAYRGIGPSAEPAGLLPPAYRGIGPSAEPAGLLPPLSSAGRSDAIIEALIASTGPRLLPSGGGDDSLGKLAAPRQTKDAVDAILRNYFKVVEAQVKEVFSAPPIKKESLNIFDHLDTEQYFNYLAQARINAENAIKRSIEEAKQVTKRNQIKDAAQSFLRALEEAVRNAERSAFTQSRIAANRSYVQRANIREIGQPLLGGRQVAPPKMLSAATGFYRGAATPPPLPETQAQLFARREREARMRSVLRGVDVMGETSTRAPARYSYANRPAMPRRPTSAIVPYEAGGALVPSGGGGGGAPPAPPRGGGGGGSFGGMQFNMPKLPGAGLVREIGEEFGFAAKQVLLYGTAYKALGLLQAFPSQVGEAVGALQSFRNTLNAISPTAQEAAASSEFILNIVDKYNVPLQSARDGFTKLYASMAPTGFSGNEIRDLFTGISQAAATFGMSSDKVDRVTYAFAQMASKGQVMSEELKGQLGDVLPGAMGIFAKAAGFEGADAIQKFGKALEDGAYKGKPMRDLLKNVTIELKKEFGPGAEGAARTYQGVMTRMANSTRLFYETFEPVAVGFLNSVVMPLTNGLRTITEGITAYFQGQQAATPEAENFNNVLKTLAPSLVGIAQNIGFALKQLLPIAQVLGAVAVQISRLLALPLVGYLAGTYLQVVLLTSGFQLLATSGLGLAILATIQFIRQGILAASVMVGLRVATQQTTLATFMFGQTLQIVIAKSVIGIALVAISALIAKIMELRGQLSAIGNDAKGMESLAKSSAKMGDIEGTKEALGNIKDRLTTFKELQKELKSAKKTSAGGSPFDDRGAISTSYQVSSATAKKLIELGLVNEKVLTRTSSGYSLLEDQMGTVNSLVNKNVNEFQKAGQKGNILIDQAIRKNREQKAALEGTGSPGEDEANKKKTSLESYYSLQDQLAKAQTQGEIDRIQDEFDHKFNLLNAYYDLEDARANSFQKATIAFQKELLAIEQRRQQSAIKAQAEVLKAQGSVAGGAPSAPALPPPSGSGGAAFDTGMRTGPSSAIGGSADYHQDIMFGSTVSMKERVQLMDQLARGYEKMGRAIEFSNAGVAGERYRSSMSYEAKSSLISRAQAAHANRPGGSGRAAMDFYAPLASSNRFGRSVEGQAMLAPSVEGASYSYGGGGRAGRTMTASRGGAMVYEQLHGSTAVPLQAKAPAPVKASEKREEVAAVTAAIAVRRENTLALNAEEMAAQETAIAYAKYVASIAPVAEQELQNSLLEKRIQLMNSGVTGDFLETQMKIFEAEEKTRIAGEMLDKTNAAQVKGYQGLQEVMPGYIASLRDAAVAQEDLNFATAKSDLNKRKAMAGALTPDAELRVELAQKYPGNLARQEEEFSQTKLVQGMEKAKQDLQNIASSISNAFGEAFKGIVTGSMTAREALAGMFQSVADSFADMVAKMIAEYLKMQLIEGIMNIVSMLSPGFGTGIAPGPVAKSAGVKFNPKKMGPAFANGGIAYGGFTAFANGGVVTGPTLGLVGEGRYNEAVIPLPDGKSVPVQLSGGDGGNQMNTNITVNVSNGQAQSNATGSNSSELGRKLEGAVKQVIVGELRPGGLLASR